jgi:hypothetical protein
VSPGLASHLDLAWTDPDLARLWRRLASFARVIVYDKPGTGLSDPIMHVPAAAVHPARGRDPHREGAALREIVDGARITLDAERDELVVRWQNPGVGEEAPPPELVGAAA